MSPKLVIQARIAQLRSLFKVAAPNTWIGTTSITKKNGKRYTYYRLMKAVYPLATEDNPNPSRKTKMVRYLGTKESTAYKEMQAAIPPGSGEASALVATRFSDWKGSCKA